MIQSIRLRVLGLLAIALTQSGQTVATLYNQDELQGSDNAAKELRFALNHQTGIFVDLVSNLTQGNPRSSRNCHYLRIQSVG